MTIDHTSFGPNGPPQNSVKGAGFRWWEEDKGEDAASSVTATLNALYMQQSARLTQYFVSSRLYGNIPIGAMGGVNFSSASATVPGIRDRLTWNIVQSAIDTVTAKMAKNKPRPLFLTSGGDWATQRKAKKLNQFCDGVFYENKAYRLGPLVFRDGGILGTGCAHVFPHQGRVRWERVLASELWADDNEAQCGDPRSLHRVRFADKRVLKELFPKETTVIDETNTTRFEGQEARPGISDLVTVRESWHLPSGKESGDGKHIITTDKGVLFEEDWEKEFFPFAFFHWCPRLMGMWGQGAAEQIQNIQLAVNQELFTIQKSARLAGSLKVLVERGSKIVKEHLSNEVGAVIEYTGTQPTFYVPPQVSPEAYQRLQMYRDQAFEQVGVSQLSASSKKPDGLDSGKALREMNDIESDRFMTIGRAYEDFFLDLARLSISAVKDIVGEEGSYKVSVPGKKFVQTINWKEIDLQEDQYVMQCWPISSLPSEPEGRLETVKDYVQAGFMAQRTGRKLLDFPDLDQVEQLANAEEDWLNQCLEEIVDKGKKTLPEPYDDLSLARELGLEYYAQGKAMGLEEKRLDMVRQWIDYVGTLEKKAADEAAAAQSAQVAAGGAPGPGAPGAAPPANPMAPPTSDLIPNTNGALPQ